MLDLIPDTLSQSAFAALLLASFGGSFITGAFGIGGGALLLAFLAIILPPAALIPVHGIVQVGSNLGRAILLAKDIWRPALPAFIAGSLVGASIGGLIAIDLPPAAVQLGVGLFVLWSVLGKPPKAMTQMPFAIGTVSSFLTMFFGATGVFIAGYTKTLGLKRHAHVATHAAAMTVQHSLKTVIFALLGFAFAEWGFVILGMIVTGFIGTALGKRLLGRLSETGFRAILDGILILIALRLIWQGAETMLR